MSTASDKMKTSSTPIGSFPLSTTESSNTDSIPLKAATESQSAAPITTVPTSASEEADNDDEDLPKQRLVIQRTHAAFVSKLYSMVSDNSSDDLIRWSEEGDSFQVTDPMEMSRKVLPRYFKHGNWQSFVRQLNMYGFHKVNDLVYGGVYGDTQIWMFKHEHFHKGEPKKLLLIKRRGPKSTATNTPTDAHQVGTKIRPVSCATSDKTSNRSVSPHLSVPEKTPAPTYSGHATPEQSPHENIADSRPLDNEHLYERISELEYGLCNIRQLYNSLWLENSELRAAHAMNQQTISNIMEFLHNTFGRPDFRSSEVQLPQSGPLNSSHSTSVNTQSSRNQFQFPANRSFREYSSIYGHNYKESTTTTAAAAATAAASSPAYRFEYDPQFSQDTYLDSHRIPSLTPPTKLNADTAIPIKQHANTLTKSDSEAGTDTPSPASGPTSIINYNVQPRRNSDIPESHIVLPPISGIVDRFKNETLPSAKSSYHGFGFQQTIPANGHPQSLRDTFSSSAKRPRYI